ncbi:MAG: hypothetical protein JSU98_01720 [Gemmatimonadales bacterium]|nr:MAG: hypothetical protein JSU98_01720 [Gemmatimonadales bacterium]
MALGPLDRFEPLEPTDLGVLIERYAPDLRPNPAVDRVSMYFSVGILTLFVGLAAYGPLGWIGAFVVSLVMVVLSVGLVEGYRYRRLMEFREIVRNRPWQLYGGIAESFRRDLEVQRARLMGPRSELGRARAPLEEALEEARRSEAYWTERCRQDPSSLLAKQQVETAERLSKKFDAALGELLERSRILLDFFNSCEAKLVALEHGRRDVEETRRLADLSDRADEVTSGADLALEGIAREVLSQAVRVGEALGAMERLRIQEAAGELPVDQMESVADQIIESADSERRLLSRLVAALGPGED